MGCSLSSLHLPKGLKGFPSRLDLPLIAFPFRHGYLTAFRLFGGRSTPLPLARVTPAALHLGAARERAAAAVSIGLFMGLLVASFFEAGAPSGQTFPSCLAAAYGNIPFLMLHSALLPLAVALLQAWEVNAVVNGSSVEYLPHLAQ